MAPITRSSPKPSQERPPKQSKEVQGEPVHTKQTFEKELKDLAAKAQQETWGKWASEQISILAQSATLLTLAAVYSNASLLTLSPVYGGIPSSIWHAKGVMSACFLGWSSNLFIRRNLPLKPKQLLPLLAAYIPVAQFFLLQASSTLGATYGPIITEAMTYFPLLLLSVSCTATILDDLEMSPGRFQWLSDAMPGISSYSFFKAVEWYSGTQIQRTIGKTFFHSRLGMQVLLFGLYALNAPSRLLVYAVPGLFHTMAMNTHVPIPASTFALNHTMAKTGWTLLERQESLTGYISIIESQEQGFRVMRCDHSLLGGEWLASLPQAKGLAEPIYGVFVMLEAVRLVKVEERIPDAEAKALVVGLGIGTTPAALIHHGISTTIVEIDPVVHEFATKYFALPQNHNAVIQDAVTYAGEVAKTPERYDYIVHDVFTGGAEPVDLFTFEFLSDLHKILKPGGVIAINYAGDLLLPSARIIVQTILTVFPTCRIYRESAAPSKDKVEQDGRDFTNMVIFCTNSALPLAFNQPKESDFLNSRARRVFLMPTHEVLPSVFETQPGDGRLLLKNETERFRGWQQQSALGHWAVMRTVLPKDVWEQW